MCKEEVIMFLNHERVLNTNSKIVHGVYPKSGKTFCGYPGDGLGLVFKTVKALEQAWHNWKYTDKVANCATCLGALRAIRRNKK
jgi:hypothetical protein